MIGVLIIAANFYWVTVAVRSQFPMAAFMPFVALLLINLVLLLVWPGISLRQGELLTVFSMLWVVGTIPMWAQFWASITAAPTHFASAENKWAYQIFDYLPWHVFAPPTAAVIKPFWFGLEEDAALPWHQWLAVLAQWLGASLAMVVFGFCLMLLFQRQWERAEKLTFPLAQMPLDLTAGFAGVRRVPKLFRSRLFWLGFTVVFAPMGYNVITYFMSGLPAVDLYSLRFPLDLPEPFGGLTIRLLPTMMAVTYLCPLDIMGSLLVFYLLSVIKQGFLHRTGFSLPGLSSVGATGMLSEHRLMINMESYGALLFVALWSVYVARGHLRRIWRQSVTAEGEPREVLRCRLVLLGLAGSGIYLLVWAVGLGMSLPVAAGVLVLIWLTYFVVVKLIAATGFAYLFPNRPHLRGESFVSDLVGTEFLAPRSLIAFKVLTSNAFFGNFCMPAWPAITHHLRIFTMNTAAAGSGPRGDRSVHSGIHGVIRGYRRAGLPTRRRTHPGPQGDLGVRRHGVYDRPPHHHQSGQVGAMVFRLLRSGGNGSIAGPFPLVPAPSHRSGFPGHLWHASLLVQPVVSVVV